MPRGWLTPNTPAPNDERCRRVSVPDDLLFVGAVTGALLPLTQASNWEQFGTMTPQEAADIMSTAFELFVASDCVGEECPPPLLPDGNRIWRRNPMTGNWEYLDDGGEEYVEPTGDGAIPSPDDRGEVTTDERKCAAAANAVHVLELLYDEVTTSISNDLDAAQALTNFIAGTVSLFVAPFWPPISGILAAAGALWNLFYEVAGGLSVGLWDTDFTERLVCIFLDNATDTSGVVTFDYQSINRDVFSEIWNNSEYVLLVSQVVYLMSVIGPQGVNWAGGTTAVSGDCGACGGWCHVFDFSVSQYGFALLNRQGGTYGTVQADGYRSLYDYLNQDDHEVRFSRTLGSAVTISRIEIEYSCEVPFVWYYLNFLGNVTVPAGTHETHRLNVTFNNVTLRQDGFLSNQNHYITIHKLILWGSGTDPFTEVPECG